MFWIPRNSHQIAPPTQSLKKPRKSIQIGHILDELTEKEGSTIKKAVALHKTREFDKSEASNEDWTLDIELKDDFKDEEPPSPTSQSKPYKAIKQSSLSTFAKES